MAINQNIGLFTWLVLMTSTCLAQNNIHKIVIIGGGPAGYAAGVSAANGKLAPVIIEGEEPGGQPIQAGEIKNFPSHKSINGAELVASMRDHAEELGAQIVDKQVTRVDFSGSPFKIWTDQTEPILAQTVIIATGSKPIKISCPGEEQYWGSGKGVIVCAKCDGHAIQDQEVVIVGGEYSALREIGNLKQYTNKITLLNPQAQLTGPQFLINNAQTAGVKILNNQTVEKILGDGKHVTGVEVRDNQTGKTSTIPTKWVLVGLGWQPNSQLFKNQITINNQDQIVLTGETSTSVPGVFAAGDVTSSARHQLFMASSSGFAAAMDAEKYLRDKNLI